MADGAQLEVAGMLDGICDDILEQKVSGGLFGSWFSDRSQPVKGLYLWGGVGRGKTFLMDAFFEVLPSEPATARAKPPGFLRERRR